MSTPTTLEANACASRPQTGDPVGPIYVVVESTAERLRYRTRDFLLLMMVPISAVALVWNCIYWLFIIFLPGWMGRGLRECKLTAPVIGFVMVAWVGRSFDFDGRAGALTRRRLYFFARTWAATDVAAVVVGVDANGTPDVADHAGASIELRSGERVEIVSAEFLDAAGWNRFAPVAAHAAGLLRVPLRIEGTPQMLPADARRVLESVAG
jgi:hypothetical protein